MANLGMQPSLHEYQHLPLSIIIRRRHLTLKMMNAKRRSAAGRDWDLHSSYPLWPSGSPDPFAILAPIRLPYPLGPFLLPYSNVDTRLATSVIRAMVSMANYY